MMLNNPKENKMKIMKHIGRHGDRKVAVLFREVPQEGHMCLVIYPDTLPAPWESAIMKVIESDMGQQAENFADALHRSLLPDGRVILETLHKENMIKKVRTADVLVTPRPDSSIRLDELNNMLNEMKTGEEAIRRMAQNDAARGMVAPEIKRAAEAAYKNSQNPQAPVQSSDDALSDRAIAQNMLTQATRMEAEAKGLIAEAARMKKDAERMDPTVVAPAPIPTNVPLTSKESVKPKRGRPSNASKVTATNAA
jgi:hypothetical protein